MKFCTEFICLFQTGEKNYSCTFSHDDITCSLWRTVKISPPRNNYFKLGVLRKFHSSSCSCLLWEAMGWHSIRVHSQRPGNLYSSRQLSLSPGGSSCLWCRGRSQQLSVLLFCGVYTSRIAEHYCSQVFERMQRP